MKNWGLYPWFPELGHDLIHPDDLATAQAHSPYCAVCYAIDQEGQYLVIQYNGHQIRAKADLFTPIETPAFYFGQLVRTKPPRSLKAGAVTLVMWHLKRASPSFFLSVDGKAVKTRYWADELEAV